MWVVAGDNGGISHTQLPVTTRPQALLASQIAEIVVRYGDQQY